MSTIAGLALTGAQLDEALPWFERLANATLWVHGMNAYGAVCTRRRRAVCGYPTDLGALRREVAEIEQAAWDAGMPLGRGR